MPQKAELDETIAVGLYPQREGYVEVTVRYTVPQNTDSLILSLPADAKVLATDGFDEGTTHSWDGVTAEPSVTFIIPADNDSSRFSGYSFVDRGGWAITQAPSISTNATSSSSIEHTRTFKINGPGIASQDGYMIFLGENNSTSIRGRNELFRLTDPAVSDLQPATITVLESLSKASEWLEIGGRSPEVIALAAPSGEADWGLTAGLQSGDCGFWTRDSQPVASPHNTWVHEYIHTRQDFDVTESTKWLIEASANYYAALLTLRQNAITYEQFYSVVSTNKDENATLADPQTWPSPFTDYKKGMRVLAALDVEIRERSDGKRTLETLFRELNARDETITHPTVSSILVSETDDSITDWLDRFVVSPEFPPIPQQPDLYDRPTYIPISGTQPLCPDCGASANGAYCANCGLALGQQCEGCSSPLLGTETFCAACGRNLERTCDSCGTKVGDRQFCHSCGNELF